VADIQQVMLARGDPDFAPDQVGRYLWRLLAATRVGVWWAQVEDAAADGDVRTVLDVRAQALRQLPWELLTCEPDGRRPFQSRSKPWARAGGPSVEAEDLLLPVRMLVVVGDPQDEDLKVDDELDAIMGALREVPGRWHVDLRVKPTLAKLRSTLEDLRPHVLHVIAHGAVASGSAVLVIPVDEQITWELTTADVANLLPSPAPCLVVLNACRSGTAGTGTGLTASWTFTDAFLRRGCGAVVTMQGNIPSTAAVPFSAAFYQEVATGAGIDVAAARGREAAYDARKGDRDDRSWAMPSLHLRARSDRVLPVALAVNANLVQQPPYRDAYEPVGVHVDRTRERWQLVRCLAPNGGPPRRPLFLVAGPDKVGKSAVVKAALLTCHLRGCQVVYVDLRPCKGAPWLPVLRYVRDQIRLWLPQAAAEPARRFDHELAFLKERLDPDRYTPEFARSDDGGDFDKGSEDFKDWIRRIFASFRTLLQATAGEHPLLLALDHLHKVYDPDLREFAVPHLLTPIAQEQVRNVHAVLAGDAGWLEGLRVADSTLRLPEPIPVPMFQMGEIYRLGREYCARRNKLPVSTSVEQLLQALNKTGEITGEDLNSMLKVIDIQTKAVERAG
jgi:CHAT domain/AAA ATPase domain